MRDSRGFDFTGYKRTSLVRRVRHRMDHAGYDNFDQYLDVLQASAEEFSALFNTILINVTSFFRDPDAWEFVRTDVIPRMLAERGPDDPIRVWSAGCASGQEAYTLAILLAEALGPDAFRQRVKIYATDIDEEALTEARAAIRREGCRVGAPCPAGALLRTAQRPLHLSQGPAPRGHLRSQ
jgi:two-component system CheB/CheR fusion protein